MSPGNKPSTVLALKFDSLTVIRLFLRSQMRPIQQDTSTSGARDAPVVVERTDGKKLRDRWHGFRLRQ